MHVCTTRCSLNKSDSTSDRPPDTDAHPLRQTSKTRPPHACHLCCTGRLHHTLSLGMKLRIGVVGAGNVGQTLGGRLAKHGKHTVRYGARDPKAHQDVGAVSVPEVCDWAEVVIVATPGFRTPAAAQALARSFGAGAAGASCHTL